MAAAPGSRDDLALVVDLGTTGLKVGLATLDGRLEASMSSQLSTQLDGRGGATHTRLEPFAGL